MGRRLQHPAAASVAAHGHPAEPVPPRSGHRGSPAQPGSGRTAAGEEWVAARSTANGVACVGAAAGQRRQAPRRLPLRRPGRRDLLQFWIGDELVKTAARTDPRTDPQEDAPPAPAPGLNTEQSVKDQPTSTVKHQPKVNRGTYCLLLRLMLDSCFG